MYTSSGAVDEADGAWLEDRNKVIRICIDAITEEQSLYEAFGTKLMEIMRLCRFIEILYPENG